MKKVLKQKANIFIDSSLFLGESVARRIIHEKRHFHKKIVTGPAAFLNSGSQGHSRGLVQLLSDSGYDSYIFSLSDDKRSSLPEYPFRWIGFDGSSITAQRWKGNKSTDSDPGDGIFVYPEKDSLVLPRYKEDLNRTADGFFESMNKLKQHLFIFEHRYYTAEKLFSLAAFSGIMVYPEKIMTGAMKDILFLQTGMSATGKDVAKKEKEAIERLDLASGKIDKQMALLINDAGTSNKKSSRDSFPIMVINPHPFDVDTIAGFEIPVNVPGNIDTRTLSVVVLNEKGEHVPAQYEKSETGKTGESRKKIVFRATVPAGSTTRYSCFFEEKEIIKSVPVTKADYSVITERSKLVFDLLSGSPSVFEFEGQRLLGKEGMRFYLSEKDSETITGLLSGPGLISETGPVRTVIESNLTSGSSSIHVSYLIPGDDPYFDVEVSVNRLESEKTLIWSIPVGYNMNCIGRVISGINCCKHRKREFVFRDWLGMKNFEGDVSLSLCANGAYGYDIAGNTVRIALHRGGDLSGSTFRFRLFPGNTGVVIDRSFNNSDLFNNPLITYPVYHEEETGPDFSGIRISDSTINLQSVRINDTGDLVLRLLNPCKDPKKFTLELMYLDHCEVVEIGSKKLMTLVFEKSSGRFIETDLLERIKT